MFRSVYTHRTIGLIAGLAALGACALVGGCGNSQVDTSASAIPPPDQTATNVAVSGPAVSESIGFSQLALETPVRKVKNKNGQVFLKFRYADNDGSIYDCELPEAMSKGNYAVAEWARTFNAYRLPKVVGHKKRDKTTQTVGDFPFISPRPKEIAKPAAGAAKPSVEMPRLPAMPTTTTPAPDLPNPMMRGPGPMGGAAPVDVKPNDAATQ